MFFLVGAEHRKIYNELQRITNGIERRLTHDASDYNRLKAAEDLLKKTTKELKGLGYDIDTNYGNERTVDNGKLVTTAVGIPDVMQALNEHVTAFMDCIKKIIQRMDNNHRDYLLVQVRIFLIIYV